MRPIKFRAWDKVSKKMLFMCDGDFSNNHIWWLETNDCDDRFDIMQYTGLCDKNGKEIYERDYFKRPVSINKEMHGEWAFYEILMRNGFVVLSYLCSEKGQVVPRGYIACSLLEANEIEFDMKTMLFSDMPYQLPIEIIDTVHENPELIEESK